MMTDDEIPNPYRPGAGHMPPYLAGRESERREFAKLLKQRPILENALLTGLRGVGKTVLLESFKPMAIQNGWHWVGTDLSESAAVSEKAFATRILTDLSVVTSSWTVGQLSGTGFAALAEDVRLDYSTLAHVFDSTPGLVVDKLKRVFGVAAEALGRSPSPKGIVFAYDEAQNLVDSPTKDEYPLSVLLELFQTVQKSQFPFLLVLTGLPVLMSQLVEARTYAERMFHVIELGKLNEPESRDAIVKPLTAANNPLGGFSESSVETIVEESGGYPYFIQFICREVFDLFIQRWQGGEPIEVPVASIRQKLDMDFFYGRWSRATDRQRTLLWIIAHLDMPTEEFSVQEVAEASKKHHVKPFSPSHISQMLVKLISAGLIFKNRWGRYSFAVPLFGDFICRQPVPAG